jgi:hypothetical protein
MLGQFLVEPELELPELEEPELEEPELLLPELEVPVLPVLALLPEDGVVVDELDPLLPELELVPGVELVVAALATNAPPARSPVVSAPTASTLRKRSCMRWLPFVSGEAPTRSGGATSVRHRSVRRHRATWADGWSCLANR